jgi:hypothetical protein
MNWMLAASLAGFALGFPAGVICHRRWVLIELGERMLDLGRDRGGPDFPDDHAEQDNSCSWPEIPSCERRELALELPQARGGLGLF